MTSLDEFARGKLGELARDDRLRRLPAASAGLRNFCSNDYLGLARDARLAAAASAATHRHGSGAGASRLVSGNHALYAELEARIARIKGTEGALVFGSGYLANVGTIPALVSEGDLILADALSHSCMISGARLSGARVELFRHNDVGHLAQLLDTMRPAARHCLVLTEGVFSMDGDLAPLPRIAELARAHDSWLMTDDAHGLGVIGDGRGSAAYWGVMPDVQMGTLSKSAGSLGGYVAASDAVISMLVNRARSLVYATGLPPGVVAASSVALDIMMAEPERCRQPVMHAQMFAQALGLDVPQSPILPILLGSSAAALAASEALASEGFLVTAIRPPTVPEGTARLRVTFQSVHSPDDILALAAAVRRHVAPGVS